VVSFQFRVSEKKEEKDEDQGFLTQRPQRTEHRVHREEKRQRLEIFNTEVTENGAQSSQRREPQAK
jgi:hypothetical protein